MLSMFYYFYHLLFITIGRNFELRKSTLVVLFFVDTNIQVLTRPYRSFIIH